MKIMLEEKAYKPLRAHRTDAGLDILSPIRAFIAPHTSRVIRTGVHVQLPKGTAGVLMSKSGLNINHNITSEGLIDEGYTGEIIVKLYNNGGEPYVVQEGDKISQLVVIPVLYEIVEIVDSFPETERGNNGFGSSGRCEYLRLLRKTSHRDETELLLRRVPKHDQKLGSSALQE